MIVPTAFRRPTAWYLGAGLLLLIVAGALVRLCGLSLATMGHTEIYVPNIPLPEDYGEPLARLTLERTVADSMLEPHPPGWYTLMYGWTKIVGTGLFAIRLPSVVFGVLSIALIFALGWMEEDGPTGVLAAAFLALNGHQVFWSRIARPSTLVCALGILSCIFLLLAIKRRGTRYIWLYGLVVFAGLAIEHFFWMILAGQVTFCLLNMRDEQGAYRGTLICQLLVATLATPLVTLAVARRGLPYLPDGVLTPTMGMLQFGFLFELPEEAGPMVLSLLPWLALMGGGLLLAGLLSAGRKSPEGAVSGWSGPGTGVFAVVALFSSVATLKFARSVGSLTGWYPLPPQQMVMEATAALPAVAFAAAWLLGRYAGRIGDVAHRVRRMPILSPMSRSLIAVMAIVPFTIAASVSKMTPLMAPRHLLILVPYVLLVMSIGLLSFLGPMDRWRPRIALATFLVAATAVHVASLRHNLARVHSPHDYHGLADQWEPQVQTSDVILVADHYRTTPLQYYMSPRDYTFVGRNHVTEVLERGPSRIWVLRVVELDPTPAIEEALAGYERVTEVTARNISAELYVR